MQEIAQIFFDLDGVITSWPSFHKASHKEISEFHLIISKINKKRIGKTVLTNRTSSQTFSIAYDLGASESLFVCENGSVLYDISTQFQYINPMYYKYAVKIRPDIISFLKNNFKISDFVSKTYDFQFEPCGSLIKINLIPFKYPKEKFNMIKKLILDSRFSHLVDVSYKKEIEIFPKSLNKSQGLAFLENAYANLKKVRVGWQNSIFIADSSRDIKAASFLVARGVTVAAVGNAKRDYKKIVKDSGGILAPENTSYHGSVNFILKKYFKL